MTDKLEFHDFLPFASFPGEILDEIVREGERQIDARLSTANTADQRALTIIGFQLALSLAVVGGLFSIASKSPIDKSLIIIGIFYLLGLTVAVYLAYLSVTPKPFSYPGNRPDSWMVQEWHTPPGSESLATLKAARVEQCYVLYSALYDNQKIMDDSAKSIKDSLATMISTTLLSAIVYGLVLIF